jgi:hypothetical protein
MQKFEPYDNPFWDFNNGGEKKNIKPEIVAYLSLLRWSHALRRGGQLNVDRRFDLILIVESPFIFRNSCRFVDRFFASKTCRL